jgi:hypothetical protein
MALEKTKSGDVVEYGTGHGSTQLLHDYCKAHNRKLFSYDEKEEWGSKFYNLRSKSHHVETVSNWDDIFHKHQDATVIFIDHAPGERRKVDIMNYVNLNGIIVCHDTEPSADHGYQMRATFSNFKYVKDYETNGAWATALSNTHKL